MSSYAGSDDVELLYLSGLGTRSSGPPGHWFIRRLSRRQGVVLALATLVVLALLSQYSTLPTQPIRVQSLEENDKAEDSNARPDKPHHVEVELDPEYANTLASSHLTDETTNSHKYYEAVLNGLPTAKFRGKSLNMFSVRET